MTAEDALKFATHAMGAAERSLGYDREYFLRRALKWKAQARILARNAPLAKSRELLARVRSASASSD
jgi:hypothetical protein